MKRTPNTTMPSVGGVSTVRGRRRLWGSHLAVWSILIVGALLPFPGATPAGVSTSPPLLMLLLLAGITLLFRTRFPLPVLASCVGIFGVAAVLGILTPIFVLPLAFATFSVARRQVRALAIGSAIATAVAIVLISILVAQAQVLDPRTILLVVTIAAATAGGDAVRTWRAYADEITERAIRAERAAESEAKRQVAEERLRIARDLHDVVAHQMTVITLHASVASSALRESPDEAERSLATIRDAARAVLGEIGDLLAVIQTGPGSGSNEGRSPVGLHLLDPLLTQFTGTGLRLSRVQKGEPLPLPAALDAVAFRIAQEALTNARKHGDGTDVSMSLEYLEDSLTITIDNPIPPGSISATAALHPGHGLRGMRERVASVRGSLDAGPTAGGTVYRVRAVLPLGGTSREERT